MYFFFFIAYSIAIANAIIGVKYDMIISSFLGLVMAFVLAIWFVIEVERTKK